MEEEQGPQSISASELLVIAKRRFWWIAVPVLLGPMIGLGLTFVLKQVYTSEAFVLVEQPKVGDKYVTAVVTDQTDARLDTMQDQILSRSRLVPIIEKYDLNRGNALGKNLDAEVTSLRKMIKVTPIHPDGSPSLSGFYVSASAGHADLARGICGDVLSMFISEDLRTHQQQADATTQFLSQQLADSKKKLDQDDAALAAFKEQYMGQLPSDDARNMQMLSSTGTQLDGVTQELAQAEQQKLFQESMIAQQMAAKPITPAAHVANTEVDDLQNELAKLQAQASELRARYTPDHPDVIKNQSEIADLQARLREKKKQVVPAKPALASAPANSPELNQMRLTLNMAEATIRSKQDERARLQRQLQNYEGKIQLSPAVEEKYKVLTRDYESSLQFYKDLLSKETQSEMATDLERQQEGEQFKVMDQPSLPGAPSFPKHIPFTLGGLGGGLLLGCFLAFLQEKQQQFIRTEKDVERFLALPILAGIPELTQK